LALQQQDRSFDDIVLPVLADDAVALEVGELQLAEVAQQDRRAVALRHHDGAELVQRLHEADGAHDESELAAGGDAAAGTRAIGVDGGFDVGERQVEPDELLRIELELELGGDAAEIRNVGDTGNLLERGNDDPALDFGKLALTLGVGFYRVVIDLA